MHDGTDRRHAERQPYIMGVLRDGREVPVQDMSQGQRHQLFLALRLACLERHFEHNEPMPLILDDLLVQLDDVSARAALEIISEIAHVTQSSSSPITTTSSRW